MKTYQPNVIDHVVNQDLCTGCGACVYQSGSAYSMQWNDEGFLVPTLTDESATLKGDISVCPFNPWPEEEVRTEDELAKKFLNDAPNFHPKVGKYYNTYAGYSEQFRLTSSSGGLATFILTELLEQKIVDAVISVGEGANNHYEYKLIRTSEELLGSSKTRYFPVTMAEALTQLKTFDGKVAVVGIGCFLKAVRLLQQYNPELKEKIIFTVGIICGGLKSKFFGEFLAAKAGVENNKFHRPEFRIKNYSSTAGDYSYGCTDSQGQKKQVRMMTVGDMWGTGMFKNNACDFCDDVTTELADISLGDAWIPPYTADGKGTSVIVTRSALAEKLIGEGIRSNQLKVEELPFDLFLASQQGSFNHRHKALKYRIRIAEQQGAVIPPKRHDNENITVDFKWVQNQRGRVRRLSLKYWVENRNLMDFVDTMEQPLNKLASFTLFYHRLRLLKTKIFK